VDHVWRPARKVLVVAGIWLLVAAISLYAIIALDLTGAFYPLTAALLLAAYYLLLGTRGCTEFTDEGVHNTLLRTAAIPWDEVDRIQLVRSGRAAWLQLVLDRRRIRLAAPRTGLLAKDPDFDDHLAEVHKVHEVTETRIPGWLTAAGATVAVVLVAAAVAVLDRPWLNDWWPGVPAVAATPAPCGVLDPATLDRVLTAHHDTGTPTDAFFGDGCQWRRLGDLDWDLVVSYDRFTRSAKATAAATAADAFMLFTHHDGRRPVQGLGDEAYTWTNGSITSVLVRKANVIVEVEFNGDPGAAVELAAVATKTLAID
jgi:hypothetical protein